MAYDRRQLMAVAMMASLPMPPTTMTAILAHIALALPRRRIGRQGGGHAMMQLMCCCHGCCCWCHLCLHSQNDGAKKDDHSNRQGCNADIHSRKEVGHQEPIGVEVTQGQPVQCDNQLACCGAAVTMVAQL